MCNMLIKTMNSDSKTENIGTVLKSKIQKNLKLKHRNIKKVFKSKPFKSLEIKRVFGY